MGKEIEVMFAVWLTLFLSYGGLVGGYAERGILRRLCGDKLFMVIAINFGLPHQYEKVQTHLPICQDLSSHAGSLMRGRTGRVQQLALHFFHFPSYWDCHF